MAIATSSKTTSTTVAALAALGLSAAAGFAYWGVQNWETFNSDYYKEGYVQEVNGIAYNDEEKEKFDPSTTSDDRTSGIMPVTPGYRIPADIIPGYRLPGDILTPPVETTVEPSDAAPEPVVEEKQKEVLMDSQTQTENPNLNVNPNVHSAGANTNEPAEDASSAANTNPNVNTPTNPSNTNPNTIPANTNPNIPVNTTIDPNKKENL